MRPVPGKGSHHALVRVCHSSRNSRLRHSNSHRGLGTATLAQPATASVSAAHLSPRDAADDTVRGAFSSVGNGFPTGGRVQALAIQGDGTLFAGGEFTQASDAGDTAHIAFLSPDPNDSARQWHSVGGGLNDTVYALAVQGDDTVCVGGAFTSPAAARTTRTSLPGRPRTTHGTRYVSYLNTESNQVVWVKVR